MSEDLERELREVFAQMDAVAKPSRGYGGRFGPGLAALGERAREISDRISNDRTEIAVERMRRWLKSAPLAKVPENFICDDYTDERERRAMIQDEQERIMDNELAR